MAAQAAYERSIDTSTTTVGSAYANIPLGVAQGPRPFGGATRRRRLHLYRQPPGNVTKSEIGMDTTGSAALRVEDMVQLRGVKIRSWNAQVVMDAQRPKARAAPSSPVSPKP